MLLAQHNVVGYKQPYASILTPFSGAGAGSGQAPSDEAPRSSPSTSVRTPTPARYFTRCLMSVVPPCYPSKSCRRVHCAVASPFATCASTLIMLTIVGVQRNCAGWSDSVSPAVSAMVTGYVEPVGPGFTGRATETADEWTQYFAIGRWPDPVMRCRQRRCPL